MGNEPRARKWRWLAWRLLPSFWMALAAVAALLGRDWLAAVVSSAASACLAFGVPQVRFWYQIGYLTGAARASAATLQAIASTDDEQAFTDEVLHLIHARKPEPWNWQHPETLPPWDARTRGTDDD